MNETGLIVNCSPRKGGNSEFVARRAGEALGGEVIAVHDLSISPCRECNDYCLATGECALHDDMDRLYPHFESDGMLVIVTPVYFFHMPGYAKLFIDRCQPYWVRKYLLGKEATHRKKPAAAVLISATGGEKTYQGLERTIRSLFSILYCREASRKFLHLSNVDNKGDVVRYTAEIDAYFSQMSAERAKKRGDV